MSDSDTFRIFCVVQEYSARNNSSAIRASPWRSASFTYGHELRVLGLDSDLEAVACDGAPGQKLQDLEQLSPKRPGATDETFPHALLCTAPGLPQ